jgi:hypothetical protein
MHLRRGADRRRCVQEHSADQTLCTSATTIKKYYERAVRDLEIVHAADLASATALAQVDKGAFDAALGGEGMLLGGSPFVLGAHGRVAYRWRASEAVVPWLAYRPIYRDYSPAAYAGYTGFVHDGALGVNLNASSDANFDFKKLTAFLGVYVAATP